jgi:glycosyltransferase involved in cell wall biosynthesis
MKIKVAMVGPFHPEPAMGGVEQHVHYLSNALEEEGVEVERWSWKVPGKEAGGNGKKGGKGHSGREKGEGRGGIRSCSLFGLGEVFSKTKADIVHLHSTAIAFSALSGLGKFGGRTIATIHAFYDPKLESSFRMKVLGVGLAPLYEAALKRTRNIAVSTYTQKDAGRRGIRAELVLGSGIPLGDMRKIRERAELESDIILVARLNEQKGVFDFLEAFGGLAYKCVIVGYGSGGMEKRIAELADSVGIRCLMRPGREETLSAIKSSKLLAFPSRNETFGIVGLEAMALGKPVVVYEGAGGPMDYVTDGYNGRVVSSRPDALRIGAMDLIEDEKAMEKMGKACMETAKAHSWEKVAKKMKAYYSLVLEEPGPSVFYRKR